MADERHDWFLNQIFNRIARRCTAILAQFTSGAEDIEDLVQNLRSCLTLCRTTRGQFVQSFAISKSAHNSGGGAGPAPKNPGDRQLVGI